MFVTIATAGLPGFAGESTESNAAGNLTIELHIYDYAQVEPQELARAQDEASRVLARIGIETHWRNCPVPGRESETNEACRSAAGTRELVLRILPQAMAERMARPDGSLGFAQLPADGTPGYVASVFYHRVESLSVELDSPRAVILGYALAHEIGHLLLGQTGHAPHGIMRALWTEKEMLSASAGRFGFMPPQAARMRASLQARTGSGKQDVTVNARSASTPKE